MTFASFYHRSPLPTALLALVLAAIGCANTTSLPTIELARSQSRTRQPLSSQPPDGATQDRWSADAGRLPIDVGRAIDACHWGRLSTRFHHADNNAEPRMVVRATALLADGREAAIVAQSEGDADVAVAVRVGRYGDGELEKNYLDVLRSVLAGAPKRERHDKFVLPE